MATTLGNNLAFHFNDEVVGVSNRGPSDGGGLGSNEVRQLFPFISIETRSSLVLHCTPFGTLVLVVSLVADLTVSGSSGPSRPSAVASG